MRRGNEEVCVLEIVRPGMEDSESAEKQENTGIGPASLMMLVRGSRECGRSYCALAHPNSGSPEFGHFKSRPKSDESDFGCGRGQLSDATRESG
jgi:hypothetical protein